LKEQHDQFRQNFKDLQELRFKQEAQKQKLLISEGSNLDNSKPDSSKQDSTQVSN
jgi:hypothetical protein